MKYIIIDEINGDIFPKEFNDKEEALTQAEKDWNHLSDNDKKRRTAFYVLESINPDEDAPDHLDGNPLKEYK